MTKIKTAKKKISRQLGVSLWGRANDPFIKRNYRPGEHGTALRRDTNHSIHLKAKQKIRNHYNMIENQFKTLFKKASKAKGDRAENFAGALESRLVTIVYRSNMAPTIFAAKQLVSHKHVLVNGKCVNIPSYSVKPGDVIEIREKSKGIPFVIEAMKSPDKDVPSYIEVDTDKMTAKYLQVPHIADVPYPFEAEYHLIVEFYSM